MKKTIISLTIIILVGISYLITSWSIGNAIRNNIDTKLEQITKQINTRQHNFKIAINYSDYQKNIFSTKLHLTIQLLKNEKQPVTLFNDNIIVHHGPFPFSALSQGQFSPQIVWIDFSMPKALYPNLLLNSDDKSLLKGYLSINFQENTSVKLVSHAIDHFANTLHLDDYDIDIKQLDISTGELFLLSNKDFSDLTVTLKLDNAEAVIDDSMISLNNLKLTIVQLEDESGFAYISEINQLSGQKGAPPKSSITIKDIQSTGNIYENQQYDVQIAADKLTVTNDTDETAFIINNLLLTQKNALAADKLHLNGKLTTAIESLVYGQQNLGRLDMSLSYQGLTVDVLDTLNNDFSHPANLLTNKSIDEEQASSFLSLDKLIWYNPAGQMSASVNANLLNTKLDIDHFNLEALDTLKLKINIPFHVLSYMAAQLQNPNSTDVTQEQLNAMNQSIQMVAVMLSRPMPIFVFNNANVEGIYSDLNYTKNAQQAQLNGETISKHALLSLFRHYSY